MGLFTKRYSFTKNSSGFSLMSVMVATALIAILTMTIMQLAKMISVQSRRAADLEDLNNVTKQVTSLLTVADNCKSLYGTEVVDTANIGATATPQLEVSTKEPFSGAGPMTNISSGRIKLLSMKLQFKRPLAGAGTEWYQGDAILQADDPTDLGNFSIRKIPVNVEVGSGAVVSCAAAGLSITSSSSTGLAYGQCGPGQVMTGISANGVNCTGGGQTVSGKGCTGDNCVTSDEGPCFGINCKTNGSMCKGINCTACNTCATCSGVTPSCNGINCCAGSSCPGC